MEWNKLLPYIRLGNKEKSEKKDGQRSAWQRDYDRIAFSSAFRRLQDKTQVFPLSESDYPRTRLTHSIESSIVGRSLGIEVGRHIIETYGVEEDYISPFDIGFIVASACLAHDIGNPPFGHSGEEAIRDWFRNSESKYLKDLSNQEKSDFLNFEGNAQGFGILTRLQKPNYSGGIQLTYATLGAYSKYPRESFDDKKKNDLEGISSTKHGFLQMDKETFLDVANILELKPKIKESAWFRHPLAFLVEAADDICYQIIDLEDGLLLKHITLDEAENYLKPLCGNNYEEKFLDREIYDNQEIVEYLRARAIYNLIKETAEFFIRNEADMRSGRFDKPILSSIDLSPPWKELDDFNKANIYKQRDVVSIEMSGFKVLAELFNLFVPAALDLIEKGDDASPKSRKFAEFIFDTTEFDKFKGESPYRALITVTDRIAGMTDSFAVATYRKITGMSLPNR